MKRKNENGEKITTAGDAGNLHRCYSVATPKDGTIHNCAVVYETNEQYNRDYREYETIARYELDNRDDCITKTINTSKIHFYYSNSWKFASRETKKRNI